MDKTKFILVNAKWLEKGEHQGTYIGEPMQRMCAVLPDGLTDEQEDAAVEWLFDDDNIFYVFAHDEDIIGKHLDFEVESYEDIDYQASRGYLQ